LKSLETHFKPFQGVQATFKVILRFADVTSFLRLFHIVPVVSWVPFCSSIVSCVSCRYLVVSGRGGLGLCLIIPLYVVDWSIVFSLAPCMSNSGGICRSSRSGMLFSAPSFSSLSLFSFPNVPLWVVLSGPVWSGLLALFSKDRTETSSLVFGVFGICQDRDQTI
jgi:hypothetical protein